MTPNTALQLKKKTTRILTQHFFDSLDQRRIATPIAMEALQQHRRDERVVHSREKRLHIIT